MDARFENWENEIRQYCEDNGLNFEKSRSMTQSYSDDFLMLECSESEREKLGYTDEIPMPIVLIMRIKNGRPAFKQTRYTRMYLT